MKNNLSTHQHLMGWVFGLGVLTVFAIGVPVMLWAEGNGTVRRANVDVVELTDLESKVSDLQLSLQKLQQNNRVVYVSMQDESRSKCLNLCRDEAADCAEDKEQEICDNSLESCVTKCDKAPPEPTTCRDYCAVSLSSCLQRVIQPQEIVLSDEESAIADCKQDQFTCLQDKCSSEDAWDVEENFCMDQCKRMEEICNQGALDNQDEQNLCQRLSKVCVQRLCDNN